jgi:integrase
MSVRKKPNGTWFYRTWVRCPDGVRRRVYGQPGKFGLSNTKVAAQQAEAMHVAKILAGQPIKEPIETRSTIPTIDAFWETVAATSRASNKSSSVDSKEQIYRDHIKPRLGHMRLDAITYAVIEDFKLHLAEKLTGNVSRRKDGTPGKRAKQKTLSRKTINNILTVLRKMLSLAEKRRLITAVPSFDWLKLPPPEIDFLSFEEAAQLEDGTPEDVRPMVLVALRTGLRLAELRALRWEDVDLKAGKIVVRRALVKHKRAGGEVEGAPKSNKPREVPLGDEVLAVLKASRHLRGPRVFCDEDGEVLRVPVTRYILERACREAKVRDVGWHVLRHTFASHLVMRGVSIRVVQELLGHADIRMTMRYAHLSPDVSRDAVRVLDRGAR